MNGGNGWYSADGDHALGPFISAGIVGDFERQLVTAAVRALDVTGSTATEESLLALALVARSTRLGHVCLDLTQVHRQVDATRDDDGIREELVLPDPSGWLDDLRHSPLVASEDDGAAAPLRPMVLAGQRLYLQRYWAFEVAIAGGLSDRQAAVAEPGTEEAELARIDAALDVVFGADGGEGGGDGGGADQRRAARRALTSPVSVIAGGPGTGKTHTVSRVLAAAHLVAGARGQVLRSMLAAPTGKAANRMRESIGERVTELESAGRITSDLGDLLRAQVPMTLHRLLGATGRSGYRYDRRHPLPVDLVVVDETSMVSLPLLARLLDAVPAGARLVLVGDPFQLTSIEAGTVMSDLVGTQGLAAASSRSPLAGRVTELRRGFRFTAGSATAELALAIRDGNGDSVLERLASGQTDVRWVQPEDTAALAALRAEVVDGARQVVTAALDGSEAEAVRAAIRIKVLAAVRLGPNGLSEWSELIADAVRDVVPAARRGGWPRVGTPVMVTRNDATNGLANGDVGVVVDDGTGSWVALGGLDDLRRLAPARLSSWEPWWAMTIHKSQGSEFPHAVVALPTVDSPILTRELLYTAVTRAKPVVTVVGSAEMIRLAVSRPVARASGLRDRLWPGT